MLDIATGAGIFDVPEPAVSSNSVQRAKNAFWVQYMSPVAKADKVFGYIYLAQSRTTGKLYVGHTRQRTIEQRWEWHLNAARRAERKNRLIAGTLHADLIEHGVSDFDVREAARIYDERPTTTELDLRRKVKVSEDAYIKTIQLPRPERLQLPQKRRRSVRGITIKS